MPEFEDEASLLRAAADALRNVQIARMVSPNVRIVLVDEDGLPIDEEAKDQLRLDITRSDMQRKGEL